MHRPRDGFLCLRPGEATAVSQQLPKGSRVKRYENRNDTLSFGSGAVTEERTETPVERGPAFRTASVSDLSSRGREQQRPNENLILVEALELQTCELSDVGLTRREVRRELLAQAFPKRLKQIRLRAKVAIHGSGSRAGALRDGFMGERLVGVAREEFKSGVENVLSGNCSASLPETCPGGHGRSVP